MNQVWITLAFGVLIGVAVAQVPSPIGANPATAAPKGAWPSYMVQEEFWMSVGVDNLGNHGKRRRLHELRQHVNVPAHYGSLHEMTTGASGTTLWFKDREGLLRNVLLENPGQLYRIQRFDTERYEALIVR